MIRQRDNVTFRFPEGFHYECRRCGECCRDFWEISVDRADVDRISALDWRECSNLNDNAKSPFVPSRSDPSRLVLKRAGNACGFLGEDQLCALHKRYGFEMKPRVCRTYPFRFIQAPDGVYVGVSFACLSVIRAGGPPVEGRFGEIAAEFDRNPASLAVAGAPRLRRESDPMAWEDYKGIERALDEILAREDKPLTQCLVAGHVWLGMLDQLTEVAKDEAPGTPMTEIVRSYVAQTRKEGFARAFSTAAMPVAQKPLKPMILGTFLSFRDSLLPGAGRLRTVLRLAFTSYRHFRRAGKLTLPPLRKTLRYRDLRPDPAKLDAPDVENLMRRYFRHTLFRKELLRYPDVFLGYSFLILAHGLTQWYAAALEAGGEASGEADPALALRLVEKNYVFHSNFHQVFLLNPTMSSIIHNLLKRPNFAHTVVQG